MSADDAMEGSPESSVPSGRREALILLTLLGITAAALVGVGALVNRFQHWQSSLAQRMNERGQLALRAGQSALAINFFRSSLSFDRDNPSVVLNLAESLIAEKRFEEAQSYLHALWERQPENGTVNLELARLTAQRHQAADALRYYHNAIYGIWNSDPVQNRVAARLELINFLLQQNSSTQVESELIAMEPGLPPDSQLHTKVGQLFLTVSDYRSAENEFLQALKLNRNNEAAAAGAGKAAFRLGHYRTAILYLDAAMANSQHDAQTQDMLDTARMVLESDPFLRNLSGIEREERILKAYRTASNRLQSCVNTDGAKSTSSGAPNVSQQSLSSSLQDLTTRERQLRSQMTPERLMRNPELPAAAMSFAFEVEEQTTAICGEPGGRDQALLLIGRNREGVER